VNDPNTKGLGERPRLLCVAPAWNEGVRIERVVQSIPAGLVDCVLVVDDGSTDDTAERARRAGAEVICNEVNRGVGAAIRSGVDYARSNGYGVVVVISGGGKTPPEHIPDLIGPVINRSAELVQGSRYVHGGHYRRMPLSRRLGTRAYTLLFSLFVRRRVTDASSGFRAFDMALFDDRRIDLWQSWLDRYELEPYLLFKAIRLRHRVIEVPVTIEYPERDGMKYTKMRVLTDWWKIFRPVVFLGLGIRR
jgi:dolichol-phosphate mannosyltransferase